MVDRYVLSAAGFVSLFALAGAALAPAGAQDRPGAEVALPDGAGGEAVPAPTSSASAHRAALCARLGELAQRSRSPAERGKAAQTQAALHCPARAPIQAAEGGGRAAGR